MKNLLFFSVFFFIELNLLGQDIKIYHGNSNTSVMIEETTQRSIPLGSNKSFELVRDANDMVIISILNPNLYFYKYEIKTEDVDIKEDYADDFSEIVKLINALPDIESYVPASLVGKMVEARKAAKTEKTDFENYADYLKWVESRINIAKGYIQKSIKAESFKEAVDGAFSVDGYGFNSAVRLIENIPIFNNVEDSIKRLNNFFEKTKEKDFFITMNAASDSQKQLSLAAFKSLNDQIVNALKGIVKIKEKDKVIYFKVPIKSGKQTNIRLIITPLDDSKKGRDVYPDGISIATIKPFYSRKMFEVISAPSFNLFLQSGINKFELENNLIKSSPDDDVKFALGGMAIVNFYPFGKYREFSLGGGLGYSRQLSGKSSAFFLMPTISYKSIIRFGCGVGYRTTPVGLKNGAIVGAPLPSNISNLEDVIDYKRRLAGVIMITISGFKFPSKS